MLISAFVRRFQGSTDEIARQVQAIGLVSTAKMVAGVLRKSAPSEDEFPSWIQSILGRVIEALCDYDAELPDAARIGALEASVGFVSGMPPETRREFQSLLVLIEVAPLVLGPRRRRFSELSNKDRQVHLMRWEQAGIPALKGGFRAIKSVSMMGYWSRPEAFGPIGYSVATNPGVPLMKRTGWAELEQRRVPTKDEGEGKT